MKKGDFALVNFPFTDLSSNKLRPALVLHAKNTDEDAILAFVTTQFEKEDMRSINISSREKEFNRTGLKKESIIKLNKIATLHKTIIRGKIGELPTNKIEELDDKLKYLFEL